PAVRRQPGRQRAPDAPRRAPPVRLGGGEAGDGHTVTALAQRNLAAIASLGVRVPPYPRTALRPRILHVGVGGFHRAHMAVYTDDAASDGGTWGIRGVGLLEADRRMEQVLSAQDCLYTVIARDNDDA